MSFLRIWALGFTLALIQQGFCAPTTESEPEFELPIGPLRARQIDYNPFNYYLGYRTPEDFNTPYAKYFNDSDPGLSQELKDALATSPKPKGSATRIQDAGRELNQPGYPALENGFAFQPDGSLALTIRSDVPSSMTGEMVDFWFSWHTNDTRKYKLWYPKAHQYAAIHPLPKEKASAPSYQQRYWNVTSFVDEYIGSMPYQLSIGFFDPSLMGFSTTHQETGVEALVAAFVILLTYVEEDPAAMAQKGFNPLSAVLVHQLREKPDGSGKEIRSRFWFGQALLLAMTFGGGAEQIARDLSIHCYQEMSHLGTFLPQLFQEFKNDIATKS